MRIKVSLLVRKGNVVDYNHCYDLASEVRRALSLSDVDFSSELYTFSRIMVKNRSFEVCREGMRLLTDQLYFFFSSLNDDVCKALANGLIELRTIRVKDVELEVSGIEVIKESTISDSEKFVTLSPVSFRERSDDFERELSDYLTEELLRRHVIAYGSESEECVRVKVLKCKPVRIKVGKKYVRGYLMVFHARGNQRLLEIGYKSGFGRMTQEGFGMVKTTKLGQS